MCGIIFSELLLMAILKGFLLSTKLRLLCSGHRLVFPTILYLSLLLFLSISAKDFSFPQYREMANYSLPYFNMITNSNHMEM